MNDVELANLRNFALSFADSFEMSAVGTSLKALVARRLGVVDSPSHPDGLFVNFGGRGAAALARSYQQRVGRGAVLEDGIDWRSGDPSPAEASVWFPNPSDAAMIVGDALAATLARPLAAPWLRLVVIHETRSVQLVTRSVAYQVDRGAPDMYRALSLYA